MASPRPNSSHDLFHFDVESLSPLTPLLQVGLIPVALLGFLSAASSIGLLCILTYRIWLWNRRAYKVNQIVVLIYNLVLANIQQAFAFLLNAQWLMSNAIDVDTRTCWAQGWLLSTGDLGSGIWSFVIGLHTFAAVIFGFKLSTRWFAAGVVLCWFLNYGLALLSVAMHPKNLFVRAVSWCWIHPKYGQVRLWTHYVWIFFFECGTVLVYASMIFALKHRIKTNFYRSTERTRNARDAAHLMIVYPVIYVVCTLPLATLRMFSMAHPNFRISGGWYCFAGAMITSNGWCDALLYSLTRGIVLFSDEPPMDNGIETFMMPWKKDYFGTETTCVHVPDTVSSSNARDRGYQNHRGESTASQELDYMNGTKHRQQGNEGLDFVKIEEKVTVEIKSEPMTQAQLRQMRAIKDGQISMDGGSTARRNLSTRDTNSDSTSIQKLWASSKSRNSSHEDVSSFAKSTDMSPVQRRISETPQSERSNSGTYGTDSMDPHTRARGL